MKRRGVQPDERLSDNILLGNAEETAFGLVAAHDKPAPCHAMIHIRRVLIQIRVLAFGLFHLFVQRGIINRDADLIAESLDHRDLLGLKPGGDPASDDQRAREDPASDERDRRNDFEPLLAEALRRAGLDDGVAGVQERRAPHPYEGVIRHGLIGEEKRRRSAVSKLERQRVVFVEINPPAIGVTANDARSY